MSNVYVWKYPHENLGEALRRFDGLLASQAASLSSAFGRSFRHSAKRVGDVLIGHVDRTDSNGVGSWRSWVDCGSYGVAWSGICEEYLGAEMDEVATRKLHETALQDPEQIGRLTGNFLLISWAEDSECVCITTGDTMSPPLWWTSGRDGWACGSRAAPLFDIVAAQPRFDADSAALFLSSSYHLSGGTFFSGTQRVGVRQQVVVRRGSEPEPREYLSVTEYLLGDSRRIVEGTEAIRECADTLVHRTSRQLLFSANPIVELSGGRDSRCVAAAIFRGGNKITAHTGGAPGSPEVRIARSLAEALCFGHSVETLEHDRLSVLLEHRDEARHWLRLSEGLETIRQGLHWERFFRGSLPVFENDTQFFSGLHFGMLKPTISMTAAGLFKNLPRALTNHRAAEERLGDIVASTNELTNSVLGENYGDAAWSLMFYWQRRCTLWGSNVMSIKYPAAWYWLPLVDRTLLRWSWQLMRERSEPPAFIDSITHLNAPHIASLKYVSDLSRRGILARGVAKAWRLLRRGVLPTHRTESRMKLDAQFFPISAQRPKMWKEFFEANDHAWKDLIDKRFVVDLMERHPQSQLLWNLATTELVAQEFF